MTSTCLKFLTKLASDKFQKVILGSVYKNQYDFIKSRTIQDCLAWAFEYIYQCKASKQPVIILKLDFAHAANLCGSLWWKDVMKLSDNFRGIAKCTVSTGDSVLFWLDYWDDALVSVHFPRLYSYAKDQNISVQKVFETEDRITLFNIPLSAQAMEEFQMLQELIDDMHYQPKIDDCWSYIWGNGIYKSKKYYKLLFQQHQSPRVFEWL